MQNCVQISPSKPLGCSNSCCFKMINSKTACCLVSFEAIIHNLKWEALRWMNCLFLSARETLMNMGYLCSEVPWPIPWRGISGQFAGCRGLFIRTPLYQLPTFTACTACSFSPVQAWACLENSVLSLSLHPSSSPPLLKIYQNTSSFYFFLLLQGTEERTE